MIKRPQVAFVTVSAPSWADTERQLRSLVELRERFTARVGAYGVLGAPAQRTAAVRRHKGWHHVQTDACPDPVTCLDAAHEHARSLKPNLIVLVPPGRELDIELFGRAITAARKGQTFMDPEGARASVEAGGMFTGLSALYGARRGADWTPRIALVTAAWGRPQLLRLMLEHHARVEVEGLHIERVVVGSPEDESDPQAIAEAVGWHYVSAPNTPLSAKWTAALQAARQLDVDGIVTLGSDDFLPLTAFAGYRDALLRGIPLYGFGSKAFLHESGQGGFLWKGYKKRHECPCGSGRLYHRNVLDPLDWTLWPEPRSQGLDAEADQHIAKRIAPLRAGAGVAWIIGDAVPVSVKSPGTQLNSYARVRANARTEPLDSARALRTLPSDTVSALCAWLDISEPPELAQEASRALPPEVNAIRFGVRAPLWKREGLTRRFLAHYAAMVEPLRAYGIELVLVAVGTGQDYLARVAPPGSPQAEAWCLIDHPNNPKTLGRKMHAGLTGLREAGVDAALNLGSDDFVSLQTIRRLADLMRAGTDYVAWSAGCYFVDSAQPRMKRWPGYPQGHKRHGEPIGAGRTYSARLLDALGWDLWVGGKLHSLDGTSWARVSALAGKGFRVQPTTDAVLGPLVDVKGADSAQPWSRLGAHNVTVPLDEARAILAEVGLLDMTEE